MNRTSTSVVAFFVGGFINLSYPEGMQIVLKHFFEVTKLKSHKKTIAKVYAILMTFFRLWAILTDLK